MKCNSWAKLHIQCFTRCRYSPVAIMYKLLLSRISRNALIEDLGHSAVGGVALPESKLRGLFLTTSDLVILSYIGSFVRSFVILISYNYNAVACRKVSVATTGVEVGVYSPGTGMFCVTQTWSVDLLLRDKAGNVVG